MYQAVKEVNSSYDALVDLLESIEHFTTRLEIYTKISPTGAMVEIIVNGGASLHPCSCNQTDQAKATK